MADHQQTHKNPKKSSMLKEFLAWIAEGVAKEAENKVTCSA
jgi:hypothetical protein